MSYVKDIEFMRKYPAEYQRQMNAFLTGVDSVRELDMEKVKKYIPWLYDLLMGRPFRRPVTSLYDWLSDEIPMHKQEQWRNHKDFWTDKLPPFR